jgi:hypothetical protein
MKMALYVDQHRVSSGVIYKAYQIQREIGRIHELVLDEFAYIKFL